MSFLSNSQYFPRSRTLLFTKQNGVLSYICREFSEVTSHLTLPNCKQNVNSISKSLCPHKQTFLCKPDENDKMELPEKLSPVSCVTSQLGARPLVCFRKIIGNDFVNLNVNISESEAIFPLKFWHCSASVPHYKMT